MSNKFHEGSDFYEFQCLYGFPPCRFAGTVRTEIGVSVCMASPFFHVTVRNWGRGTMKVPPFADILFALDKFRQEIKRQTSMYSGFSLRTSSSDLIRPYWGPGCRGTFPECNAPRRMGQLPARVDGRKRDLLAVRMNVLSVLTRAADSRCDGQNSIRFRRLPKPSVSSFRGFSANQGVSCFWKKPQKANAAAVDGVKKFYVR